MIHARSILIAFLSILLLNCSSFLGDEMLESMTVSECSDADICLFEGLVSVDEVNHVFMGRMELDSGKCVDLSLEKKHVKRLQKDGKMKFRVYGERLGKPVGMDDVDFLKVDDRRVGWDVCGDYYLFVTKVVEAR